MNIFWNIFELEDENKPKDFLKENLGSENNLYLLFFKREQSFLVGKASIQSIIQYLLSIFLALAKSWEMNQIWSLPSSGEIAASQQVYKTANGFYKGGMCKLLWEHERRVARPLMGTRDPEVSQRTQHVSGSWRVFRNFRVQRPSGEGAVSLGHPMGSRWPENDKGGCGRRHPLKIGSLSHTELEIYDAMSEWEVCCQLWGQCLTSTLFSLLSRINSFCARNCCCSSWSEQIRSVAAESWLRKIFIYFLTSKWILLFKLKSNIWHLHNRQFISKYLIFYLFYFLVLNR